MMINQNKKTISRAKKDLKNFFSDLKKLNQKELFLKWRLRVKIDNNFGNHYTVPYKGKEVDATKFTFNFYDAYYCASHLIFVYFYGKKIVKVESCIEGLSDDKLFKILKEAKVSANLKKIDLLWLYHKGGYDYRRKKSIRAIVAEKLGYIKENEVNKILLKKKVEKDVWAEIKLKSYVEWHHIGINYKEVKFYDKDILLKLLKAA